MWMFLEVVPVVLLPILKVFQSPSCRCCRCLWMSVRRIGFTVHRSNETCRWLHVDVGGCRWTQVYQSKNMRAHFPSLHTAYSITPLLWNLRAKYSTKNIQDNPIELGPSETKGGLYGCSIKNQIFWQFFGPKKGPDAPPETTLQCSQHRNVVTLWLITRIKSEAKSAARNFTTWKTVSIGKTVMPMLINDHGICNKYKTIKDGGISPWT